jgi:hypothetical protein
MCHICNLLENSIPYPKELVFSWVEVLPVSEHQDIIWDNVSKNMKEEEFLQYVIEFNKELQKYGEQNGQ